MGLDLTTAVESVLYGSPLGGADAQVLDISGGSSVTSTVLSEGLYKLCATEACWVSQGGSSITATEATSPAELIPAGHVRYFPVAAPTADGYIAAIESDGGGGTVSISRADRV